MYSCSLVRKNHIESRFRTLVSIVDGDLFGGNFSTRFIGQFGVETSSILDSEDLKAATIITTDGSGFRLLHTASESMSLERFILTRLPA